VRAENGKNVYDWTKTDQLYDDLLARRIRPFVELGFTPNGLPRAGTKSISGRLLPACPCTNLLRMPRVLRRYIVSRPDIQHQIAEGVHA
jgi:hypothetical protein